MKAIAAVLILFAGHRDLFKYVEPPPRPAVVKKKAAPVVVIAQPDVVKPPEIVIPPVPQAPQFPYRCIGTFGPASNPFAVFDGGGGIINVRNGEVIDGKFLVRAIGLESVTIGVEGFPDQRIGIGAAR
jgi:hypothetical protein